jgi:hypothetical protein
MSYWPSLPHNDTRIFQPLRNLAALGRQTAQKKSSQIWRVCWLPHSCRGETLNRRPLSFLRAPRMAISPRCR